MEKDYLFAFFSVACNTFWIVFVTSHTKQQHTSPRWNFLVIFNAAMLHCIYMKILHRGPKLKACVRYFLSNFYFLPNDNPSKTMKNFFYYIWKALCSWDIQIFVFSTSALFSPVSHCFRGWSKKNLKIYDVINCLNKNLITHFVWYLEKEIRCDI